MLTFVHPVFLVAAGFLAVPMFLHLMNRALPVHVRFPSIRFIRKAHLPREGRRELQDILLLLLRLLMFTLLILAFARPRWHPRRQAGAAMTATDAETVMLVDVSASMQGWSGLEGLRQRLQEVLDHSGREAVGMVVSADGIVSVVPPTTDRAELRRHIDRLDIRAVPGNHSDAMARAMRLFSPGKRHTLAIVSDFQQADWQFAQPADLDPGVKVTFQVLNPERKANAAVTGASVIPLADDTVRVVAEVRNFGTAPVRRTLTLQAGTKRMVRDVAVPGLDLRRTAFVVRQPQSRQARLLLDPDAYTADDTYHLWIGKFPPVKVLAVLPSKQEPEKRNELFFLQKALAAKSTASAVEFAVEIMDTEFFFALALEDIRVVLLLGAAGHFRQQEFELLRRYLENGGVVLCTPGSAVGHAFHGLRQYDLLAAEFRGIAGEHRSRDALFGLGWVNPDSLLGSVFSRPEETDLFLFPIYRYAQLRPLDDSVQILLRTLDGDPALIEKNVGRGRLFVNAFAFHPAWSDMPMTASFLPLVRELVSAALPPDHGVRRLECGQKIPVPRNLLGEEDPELELTLAAASTETPGIVMAGNIPYEVNVSRRESAIDRVNLLDLEARMTRARNLGAHPPETAAFVDPVKTTGPLPLWPYFAAAAAALFLLELATTAFLDGRRLQHRHPAPRL